MADLLGPDDLAYMRATQAEARPTPAVLKRRMVVRLADGGSRDSWGPGEPLNVRIDANPDEVPAEAAGRLRGGDAYAITLDLVLDVRSGDHLDVSPAEGYEIVSDGNPDQWATAQTVYARRYLFPTR